MGRRFVAYQPGIGKILRGRQMVNHLRSKAEQAARETREVAPRDTGDYIDSIDVTSGVEGGKAFARVVSDDPKAMYVEYGTEDTPTFAPLRRGLDSLQ